MIQLILSDLDETLLNDDGSIHQKNIDAIQKFTQNGGYFVPNTGRSYKSVTGTLNTLGLNQTRQYVVSYNGGAIIAIEPDGKEEVVAQHNMSLDLAKKIFELGQIQDDVDTHIYTLDKLFIYNISPADKQYMSERQVPYTEITSDDLTFLANEKPIMKVIFEHSEPAVRQKIADNVTNELALSVLLTFSSNRYVEFNPKGVDKGVTGLELADILHIDHDNTAALGDNLNDAAQIKAAGIGVAVANAKQEIKDIADIVLTTTNNDAAVADFIENYVI
ncbi:MAG: Cof-type HAD-IIB family hydrolase [Leuconostoc gelidum]|jgi:Cof subfamily protein (haloacid dehalogenase superfamily)|uniref:Cof-type HAD-IIB family hydrolase n=1 Tax=Leuconostoc gelidum subsp. gelidum TaxID=1607839 RepID=A0AB35G046_LEUGE|nr:Cof-type HAD-IIB family hydrolase [Leuconostoc gelidum]AFS40788.1 HAD superfamily hydrolase [Leuconostoc gelidum JB7]MBZ5963912.1 Cof-type HAD-IIB family hydrolase [Leuconostoc gelidum subsp. gelidum]MBZ5975244.1 Cof-type HAD-IIB family hydrolase [Leuconostoc gelidum subsp. gelidum]MBZ5976585.1 Cof-type HAD-IIB family hydrolase [Leuconostoc gelidum subsp. gelidum]MBZ5978680.1 Cof-type HAD-IIB family hydrolase [Leuconostoc gelidum subsp. gelidum]